MTLIPDDLIDQVRESADLVGIIAEHVELKRTGTDYRGPCPFHGGTHRNFAVIPKKGMYYCFVCHAAGDAFTFFMKKLGMDYPTAVREVARRAGIMIPDRAANAGPDPREPLFSALAAAAEWFARELRESAEGAAARDYLAGRGVDTESASMLGLGYAPRGAGFAAAMKELGLQEEVLLQAGLSAKREDGRIVPRFRGRLLFPIHDLRGRVVGFGGRILGEGEPKYLNSPDTPVFHKGQLLYNLHSAKHGIRKAERAVLVEGYFDVLRLSGSGVEEVVAPLGTGLSADQAALLAKYTKHVYLLYDPDPPGLRATFRAGDELLRHGLRVSVATLPGGQDPDALVEKHGRGALDHVLHDALDLLERKIQILERHGYFGSVPGRRRALDRLLPTIRAASDPITRDLYLARAAEAAKVRRETLEHELSEGVGSKRPDVASLVAVASADVQLPTNAEKALLLVMLQSADWRTRVLEAVDPENFTFPAYRAVFEAIADQTTSLLEDAAARALEHLAAEPLGERSPDQMFETAIDWIEADRKTREIRRIDRELPLVPDEDKPRLLREKTLLVAERNSKRPTWAVLERARRRSAPGS